MAGHLLTFSVRPKPKFRPNLSVKSAETVRPKQFGRNSSAESFSQPTEPTEPANFTWNCLILLILKILRKIEKLNFFYKISTLYLIDFTKKTFFLSKLLNGTCKLFQYDFTEKIQDLFASDFTEKPTKFWLSFGRSFGQSDWNFGFGRNWILLFRSFTIQNQLIDSYWCNICISIPLISQNKYWTLTL